MAVVSTTPGAAPSPPPPPSPRPRAFSAPFPTAFSRFTGKEEQPPTPTFAPTFMPFSVCGSNSPPPTLGPCQLISCPQPTAECLHGDTLLPLQALLSPSQAEESTSRTLPDRSGPSPDPSLSGTSGEVPRCHSREIETIWFCLKLLFEEFVTHANEQPG